MKKLFTTIIAVIVTVCLFAQAPQKMSYQAVIRDANNALVTNHTIGMRISILEGSLAGPPPYVETQTPTTNANGLVTIEIGGGTPVSGTFEGIKWSIGSYYLQTETDPTGGTNYTIISTSQLLSVPYAIYAKTAETLTGTVFSHYVGESYGGGVVFYVAPNKDSNNNEHGLIISTAEIGWADLSSFWGIHGELSKWDGAENTNYIVTNKNPANLTLADVCVEYRGGGYDDWYLPSNRELQLLYRVYIDIEVSQGPNSSFQAFGNYCSSTLSLMLIGFNSWPYYLDMSDGIIKPYPALEGLTPVRAIRKF